MMICIKSYITHAFSESKREKTNIGVAKLPAEHFDHAQLNKLSTFNHFVCKYMYMNEWSLMM